MSKQLLTTAASSYDGVGTVEKSTRPIDHDTRFPTYLRTDRRIGENGLGYHPDRQNLLPQQRLSQSDIESLLKCSNIQSIDLRVMTAGISPVYLRPDDGEFFFGYSDYCVIEGTLNDIKYGNQMEISNANIEDTFNKLFLKNCKLLAGSPPVTIDGKEMMVWANPKQEGTGVFGYIQRDLAFYDNEGYVYDTEYLKGMQIGRTYVFILKYDALQSNTEYYLCGEKTRNLCCSAIWDVTDRENYLSDESFAPLKLMCEIIDSDDHTFDIVYTSDMSMIHRFSDGKMNIVEGRMITPKDVENKASVCVISSAFAAMNGLSVGDRLSFYLGTELFEQYKGLGALATCPPRYQPATERADFEIVGIYIDLDSQEKQSENASWCYSDGTVFVPLSLLPDGVDLSQHTYTSPEVSFKVNAWQIESFIDNDFKILASQYDNVPFNDHGWKNVMSNYNTSRKVSLIRIVIFVVTTIVILVLNTYVFVRRKKKEFAITRALGGPLRNVIKEFLLSLTMLTGISVLLGTIIAGIYLNNTVKEKLLISLNMEGRVIGGWFWGPICICLIIEMIVGISFGALLLLKNGKKPVMLLLFESHKPKTQKRRKKEKNIIEDQQNDIGIQEYYINQQSERKSKPFIAVVSFFIKHALRQKGRTVFTILVSMIMIIATTQFEYMKDTYEETCRATPIVVQFGGKIPLYELIRIENEEYLSDLYYEGRIDAELTGIPVKLYITNHPNRCFEESQVEYYFEQGVDMTVFEKPGKSICVSNDLIDMGLCNIGETVTIAPKDYYKRIMNSFGDRSYEELTQEEKDLITYQMSINSCEYYIVGIINGVEQTIITAGVIDEVPGTGEKYTYLDYAEYSLCDFRRLDEAKALKPAVSGITKVLDSEKLDGILGTYRILCKLMPVITLLTIIINAANAGLSIMQRKKEIAILRILGSNRNQIRNSLVIEQSILLITGLIIGMLVLFILKEYELANPQAYVFTYVLISIIVVCVTSTGCSTIVTGNNTLGQLQTKE